MSKRKEDIEEVKSYVKGEEHNREIDNLIDSTMKNGGRVWLGSDWHLFKRIKKGERACKKRVGFDKLVDNVKKKWKDGDLLIYLGDICDGEFKGKNELGDVLRDIIGEKKCVLVRGNNDTFEDEWYKGCGWTYVVYRFKWNGILFSHPPVEHDYDMNIHGHIHFNYKQEPDRVADYWVPYNNHICVFDKDGDLIELKDVIRMLGEYKKHVKENKEKIDDIREIVDKNQNVFEYAVGVFLHEYEDEFDNIPLEE